MDQANAIAALIASSYNSEKYSDAKLIFKGRSVPVHKLVLSRSDYFENKIGPNDSEVDLTEMECDKGVEYCLQYLYTNRYDPDVDDFEHNFRTFSAADVFQLPSLRDDAKERVKMLGSSIQQGDYDQILSAIGHLYSLDQTSNESERIAQAGLSSLRNSLIFHLEGVLPDIWDQIPLFDLLKKFPRFTLDLIYRAYLIKLGPKYCGQCRDTEEVNLHSSCKRCQSSINEVVRIEEDKVGKLFETLGGEKTAIESDNTRDDTRENAGVDNADAGNDAGTFAGNDASKDTGVNAEDQDIEDNAGNDAGDGMRGKRKARGRGDTADEIRREIGHESVQNHAVSDEDGDNNNGDATRRKKRMRRMVRRLPGAGKQLTS